jgi:hypothetical protein
VAFYPALVQINYKRKDCMSRFLDRIERVSNGTSSSIGFGAARAEKLPGMCLVAQISGNYTAGLAAISDLTPDAVIISGMSDAKTTKSLVKSLSSIAWGARLPSIDEKVTKAYRNFGCDLIVFSMNDTTISALASDGIARILCITTNIEERTIWAIDTLPVDILLLSMRDITKPWTLSDLTTIGTISGRTSKYILIEVSDPPMPNDLEALRNAGVHGLVLDVGAVSPQALVRLKSDLLDLPHQRPSARERSIAVLPGISHTIKQETGLEEEDEDWEEDAL